MKAQLQSLSGQLATNRRLQLGLGAVIVLLFVFALQSLHEWRVVQQKSAISRELDLRRTRSLRGQDVWVVRAEQVDTAHKALLGEIPIVATAGLAQATMQNWLRSIANSVRPTGPVTIEVGEPVQMEEHPGILRARANVRAELTPRQAFEFMGAVEAAPNLAVVETAQVRSGEGRVAITIAAYYRTSPEEGANQ